METFHGRAHLPSADEEWNITLEIDWGQNEVNVHIHEAPGGVSEWPGLAVQTFGMEEIVIQNQRHTSPVYPLVALCPKWK